MRPISDRGCTVLKRTARDRAHRQFGLPRHSQFADDYQVKRRLACLRDFETNGEAPARERQNDSIADRQITSEELSGEKRPASARSANGSRIIKPPMIPILSGWAEA